MAKNSRITSIIDHSSIILYKKLNVLIHNQIRQQKSKSTVEMKYILQIYATYISYLTHHLSSLIDEHEILASSLKVLGRPLIVRNVGIISRVLSIDKIKIPDEFPSALQLIQDNFPSINVEEFHDEINTRVIIRSELPTAQL